MSALLFALVIVFTASLGARDQLLVARLRSALGPSAALLLVAAASAALAAALAALAGGWLAARMSEDAATMFVAFALLLAGAELAWPIRMPRAAEPTRSLGAIALVLFSRQLTDAARFAVAALAVAFAAPAMAGLGGAIGGIAAMALGWALGDRLETRLPLRLLRIVLAALLLAAGAVVAMLARGVIG